MTGRMKRHLATVATRPVVRDLAASAGLLAAGALGFTAGASTLIYSGFGTGPAGKTFAVLVALLADYVAFNLPRGLWLWRKERRHG
jgi:hypothetical protein